MEGMCGLACPRCGGALEDGADAWTCLGCGAGYRALRGIPDLRTANDGYMPNGEDWTFARRLAAEYDRLDFQGLLGRYFDLAADVPPDLRRRQMAHILGGPD